MLADLKTCQTFDFVRLSLMSYSLQAMVTLKDLGITLT